MQYGLATAKRVRSETGIARHAVSIAFAAVQLGKNIFGELSGRKVLLLGAGKMSFLVAKHLAANGVDKIWVTSRSFNHAVETAEQTGGTPVHWDDGLGMLEKVDIVVSCTDAPRVIVTREQVAAVRKKRRGEPLFLIDIAVPRDIDPEVNALDNVYLYDIDGLQDVIDSNLEERRRAAADAERLVDREVASFERWQQTQAVTPMIVALREGLLDVGRREIERHRGKLGDLDPNQRTAVEQLTRSVIQKILHRPIRHLRGAVDRGDLHDCVRLYGELFELSEATGDGLAREKPQPASDDRPKTDEGSGPTRVLRGGKDN
jgi:glutamyl-tRNA reductase